MPKSFSSREIIGRLGAAGWQLDRVRGSHNRFRHPHRTGMVTVAHPKRDIATGLWRAIFRQAGWPWPPR